MLTARCLRCDFHADADEVPLDGCPRCCEAGRAVNLVLDVPRARGLPLTLDEARRRILGLAPESPDPSQCGRRRGAADGGDRERTAGMSDARPPRRPPDPGRPIDDGVWRFAPRLPGVPPGHRIGLGEGATPLLELEAGNDPAPGAELWLKDEGLNPTGSYKDRFMAVAVGRARASGARVVVAASSGNGGTSAAAYAARAGLACVVLTTPALPEPPRRYLQALGTPVVAVPDADARWDLMRDAVEQWGWYPLTNYARPPSGGNLFGLEGYKTIAFEIIIALGGRAPDHVYVPLALGDGLLGIWRGFEEAEALGRARRTPRMVAVEPAVAAPVTTARAGDRNRPAPVETTPSVAYNVGSSRGTEQAMVALEASGGAALAASEEEIIETRRSLAEDHGIHAEASAALSVWGALRHTREGGHGVVVAVVTASGVKDPAPGSSPPPLPAIDPDLDALRGALPGDFPPPRDEPR